MDLGRNGAQSTAPQSKFPKAQDGLELTTWPVSRQMNPLITMPPL
jgi:hypothetical protein